MQIIPLESDIPYGSGTYVIISENEAIIVDPSVSYEYAISEIGMTPEFKYILITHAHFDHFLEIDDWVSKTNATVIVGEKDAHALSDSYLNCNMLFLGINKGYSGSYTIVKENDILKIGSEELRFIETPGHSPGSVSAIINNAVFVGDVIFSAFSYGRTDLPGGDHKTLCESIKRILSLPDDTVIYPGHGSPTTVKQINYYRR